MPPLARLASIAALLLAAGAVLAGGEEVRVLLRAGDVEAALARVEEALAADPTDPELRFLKGVVLTRADRYQEAVAVFERLTRDYPGLPEPYNNLAVLYASRGDFERARDALMVAIRTHPSYATAHENLGDIYARLAGEAYDRALQLDHGNTTAKAKLVLIDRLLSAGEGSLASAAGGEAPAVERPALASPPAARAAPSGAPPAVAGAPREQPAATPEASAAPEASPVPAAGTGAALAAEAVAAPRPAAAPERLEAAVRAAVHGWAEAWSHQDVDAYLGYYAEDFRPPGGLSRAAWERRRRARLTAPRRIRVAIEGLRIRIRDPQRAEVTFVQRYRSDRYRDRVRKSLTLERGAAGWRIVAERVLAQAPGQ